MASCIDGSALSAPLHGAESIEFRPQWSQISKMSSENIGELLRQQAAAALHTADRLFNQQIHMIDGELTQNGSTYSSGAVRVIIDACQQEIEARAQTIIEQAGRLLKVSIGQANEIRLEAENIINKTADQIWTRALRTPTFRWVEANHTDGFLDGVFSPFHETRDHCIMKLRAELGIAALEKHELAKASLVHVVAALQDIKGELSQMGEVAFNKREVVELIDETVEEAGTDEPNMLKIRSHLSGVASVARDVGTITEKGRAAFDFLAQFF